jgi:hypothetical protein
MRFSRFALSRNRSKCKSIFTYDTLFDAPPVANVIKKFRPKLMNFCDKLECLSLANFCILD